MSVKSRDKKSSEILDKKLLLKAFKLMCEARAMAAIYDEKKDIASRYVHSTSKGHEAIQLATAFHLKPSDFASPYYRDESLLLGLGFTPYELMLQLMAKKDDPFTGGRSYYAHPAIKRDDMPIIPHQSSATGMQVIPATGMAQGIKYLESQNLLKGDSISLCSIGDGAMTEGEVSEALQMAVLKELPIIYLVQDNNWGISATGEEMRTMDAYEFAAGFKGLKRMRIDGTNFEESFNKMGEAFDYVRKQRKPILVHAECPLLGHHTSGVRMEWYRDKKDLAYHESIDPFPKLKKALLSSGIAEKKLNEIFEKAKKKVEKDFARSFDSPDPELDDFNSHEFAETEIVSEAGQRTPKGGEKTVMVDAALHAIDEILKKNPEALLYGQDVGGRLGGVFREAATLAAKYGHDRVFNTPIQEAYIIGSTSGMSAVGAKPIVEIQFADYIWPGMNQLVEELSKSCYLTMGKFPIQSLIRVPIGAYGGGGPYHSGSIESTLLNIRGIKVVYPSNSADMKGLMKGAFYDPNPVIMLEHKGLYWSKVKGTEFAKSIEPDSEYILPLGKANIVKEAANDNSCLIITYGMGVHWALNVDKDISDNIEILDLRTLNPLDWDLIEERLKIHNRAIVLTEEPVLNSFAESLAGRISMKLFEYLDAPITVVGAESLPAIPLNIDLEKKMLPSSEKLSLAVRDVLNY